MNRCDCPGWDRVKEIDDGVWLFAHIHGYNYPENGPKWIFCPMCGSKLKKEVKDE